MKHIDKQSEPEDFKNWKKANLNATYKDLGNKAPTIKQTLKEELLKEQGYICCYCEREISKATSHIEHFKPKDSTKYPELQLSYDNLHTSCNIMSTQTNPNICGVKKGNSFSTDLISPLESDCSSHFNYHLDGTIEEVNSSDYRAQYTISLLGLDDSFLNAQRAAALQPFLDELLTDSDLKTMTENYLRKNVYGKLNPFYTMIESLFS